MFTAYHTIPRYHIQSLLISFIQENQETEKKGLKRWNCGSVMYVSRSTNTRNTCLFPLRTLIKDKRQHQHFIT
ncbi:unnamed protein product [Lactuca virosa]|uniref:Uncharacterized protein n=1 Tax=Lactuca virosa TaxID=75947 RepID=A0AAU9LDV8_9ASTR|nr:unnamed protein product [Lactuca virosa]